MTTVWTPQGSVEVREKWKEDIEAAAALLDEFPGQLEPDLRCFRRGKLTVLVGTHPDTRAFHVSVMHTTRYPTWDEIKVVRYTFCPDEGCYMALILPPSSQYINLAPNCFHLHEIHRPPEV